MTKKGSWRDRTPMMQHRGAEEHVGKKPLGRIKRGEKTKHDALATGPRRRITPGVRLAGPLSIDQSQMKLLILPTGTGHAAFSRRRAAKAIIQVELGYTSAWRGAILFWQFLC